MVLYRHKGFQTSLQADPYERGIEGRPFQNFRKHNVQEKVNQELKRKQFKPYGKNRQICRKRRLRKMMEPAHFGNNP